MKSLLVAVLAIAGGTLAAAPASAGYAGAYLATFTGPSGPFQHCFVLTQTQQYLSEGFKYSGTWVDSDFPDTSGTWAVYANVMHLAGTVDGDANIAIDGRISKGQLAKATFDYFDSTGIYFDAGSLVEQKDPDCAGAARVHK
jgi:hypothetical protein